MHVDAFFDYLMDRRHPYWTDIPSETYPVSDHLRDGVAAKDDMALRALLPEIKPRRGRRRPDDDADQDLLSSLSPSQRPRLEDLNDDASGAGVAGRWSAHPDSSSAFVFPPPGSHQSGHQQHLQQPDMRASTHGNLRTPPLGASWTGNPDILSTPLSAYPRSAITPSTKHSFWADEPKSAITPTSGHPSRRPGRRHGAKVVSSAWRSSGGGGSGKTRGRPPINRHGNHHHLTPTHEGSFTPPSAVDRATPAFPTTTYASQLDSIPTSEPPSGVTLPELSSISSLAGIGTSSTISPAVPQLTLSGTASPSSAGPPRGNRPSRLSLQVPERKGAEVRLASPPMHSDPNVVMSEGESLQMHVPEMSSAVVPNMTTAASLYRATFSMESFFPASLSYAVDREGHAIQTPGMGDKHSSMAGASVAVNAARASAITPPNAPGTGPAEHTDPSDSHETAQTKKGSDGRPLPPYMARFGSGDSDDRTNIADLEAYFLAMVMGSTWVDENNNEIPQCSVEEGTALIEAIIANLTSAAASKEAFLINLAALAGSKVLLNNPKSRIKRLGQTGEYSNYECCWELCIGDVRGQFSIKEKFPSSRLKTLPTEVRAAVARAVFLDQPSRSSSGQNQAQFGVSEATSTIIQPEGQSAFNAAFGTTVAKGQPQPGDAAASQTPSMNYATNHTPPDFMSLKVSIADASTAAGATPGSSASNLDDENMALAALWERRYRDLLRLVSIRENQIDRMRASLVEGLHQSTKSDDEVPEF